MKLFLRKYRKSLFIIVASAAIMQAVEYYGLLTALNAFILDRLLLVKAASVPNQPISTIEIDDAAFHACFASTSPLDPKQLIPMLSRIAEAHPAVIGIDVLTDLDKTAPAYQFFEKQLPTIGSKLVWISGFDRYRFEQVNFGQWLLGKEDELIVRPSRVFGYPPGELDDHPAIAWGLPVYPPDDDAEIRRSLRAIQASADPQHSSVRDPLPSFPQLVTDTFCHDSKPRCASQSGHEVLITYGEPKFPRFNMLDLFQCPSKGQIIARNPDQLHRFSGNIVLIGGTFSSSPDFHKTPEGPHTPGLLVNAYAVRAMIAGKGIQEVSQPWAWILDIAMGLAVLFVFEDPICRLFSRLKEKFKGEGKVWWAVAANVIAWLFLLCLTQLIAGEGYVLGLVGTAFGTLIGIMVDATIYAKNKEESVTP